jgi:mono/diheme cytochrome c family protein
MKLRLRNWSRSAALALVIVAVTVIGILVAVVPFVAALPGPAASADSSGAAVFKAKCVTCHGSDGSSNTAVGKSLNSADLRSAEVQKKSDAELTQSVAEGKGNMPAFKTALSEDELHAAIAYVRTFASKTESAPKKKSGN